ncbi:MAG: SCO family protein, partial [Proteobacteria bacterium]|nr:SCO family protein [Pseudomonadota bacterium]
MKQSLFGMLLCLVAAQVSAHGTVVHQNNVEAQQHLQTTKKTVPALPFDLKLGGSFELTDHNGNQRTEANPDGHMQLLFFGYANCASICTVALPLMGDVVDDLAGRGLNVTPVMITIDPKRDTLETIGTDLQKHHPDFVGLTGNPDALQNAYDLYSIEHKVVFTDPQYGKVFAHGSHIYLLDAKGKFLTLLPPILSAERIVEIVQKYA